MDTDCTAGVPIEVEQDEPCAPDEASAELEAMTEPFDPTKISVNPTQMLVQTLIQRLRANEIDMNTDFQRHADLWDNGRMSRFIESICIRFPLPAFYFDASVEDSWQVVDGLQRLSAIRRFVIDQEEPLKLTGLEYLTSLKGKTYPEIGRQFQRRIDEQPIIAYLIGPGTPVAVKYSVFRRINTGGLTLNNQEIRHAMALPRERRFLNDLAADKNLTRVMGDQQKRMMAHELALRFVAFLILDYQKSPKNIASFLDDAMERVKEATDAELRVLADRFRHATRLAWELFGDEAFEKKASGDGTRRRKNSALFEVWTVSLARLAAEAPEKVRCLLLRRGDVVERLHRLVADDRLFYQSISMATQKREHVRIRFESVQKLIEEVCCA